MHLAGLIAAGHRPVLCLTIAFTALSACGARQSAQSNPGIQGKPEPASSSKPEPPSSSKPAAPVPSGGVDDPSRCVEASSEPNPSKALWQELARQALHIGLKRLQRCSSHMKAGTVGDATLAVQFDRHGYYHSVGLLRNNLSDCAPTDCIKQAIAQMDLRVLDVTESFPLIIRLKLERGKAPSPSALPSSNEPNANTESAAATDAAATCTDNGPNITGRLPPEVIQQTIRKQYSMLRECYEAALARNPRAMGKIEARFVIDLDGQVRDVHITSNSLPDCAAVACMHRAFERIEFPPPAGGIVTVVYPILFQPG